MITELWATPILQMQIDDHQQITKDLLDIMPKIPKPAEGELMNVCRFFDRGTSLIDFTDRLVSIANDFVLDYENERVELLRAWFNYQRFGDNKDPHVHHGTKVAAVYYMNAPTYCGDLLLFDPRGGVHGWDHNEVIYHRITPQPGMLLMFPGYVTHVTEQNRNREPRISFVANIGVR